MISIKTLKERAGLGPMRSMEARQPGADPSFPGSGVPVESTVHRSLTGSIQGASNKTSVTWLTQLLVTAAVTALALFTVHLYGAFGVFSVYSEVSHVQNWPWWVFQTLMRGIEVTICLIVILITSKTPSSTGFAVVFRTVIQVRKKCRLKNAVIPMEDRTHPTSPAMNTQASET